MAYIEVRNIHKRYRHVPILIDVSVHFTRGQIHGVIGRNGSGKTQLFKVICGYVTPDSGKVTIDGQRIGQDILYPPRTGLMLEHPGFLLQYSGYTNLSLLMGLSRKPDKAQIKAVLCQVGLQHAGSKRVGIYSMGMRQRLGIAQAIMESPELLILDEPFNGLDKQGVADIRQLLKEQKQRGATILLASHMAGDIEELCDTVHEMDAGRLRRMQ